VAKAHLGGPAAWGVITAAESVGLIVGGVVSLRFTPRRPMRFVAGIGAAIAISPASLAMLWPLPVICLASFGLGITMEIMMVQWTVALARNIPPDKLARVSSYDLLGSVMAMPVGALIAGPLAAAIGVSAVQYGAAALIVVASALALIPRDVRCAGPGGTQRPLGTPPTPMAQDPPAYQPLGPASGRPSQLVPASPASDGDQETSSASPVNVAHIVA
jgi:MFS family permease